MNLTEDCSEYIAKREFQGKLPSHRERLPTKQHEFIKTFAVSN